MADTEYKRLIQSAKERALFAFLAVVQRAIQDADRNIVNLLSSAKSGADQSALTSVRHFLRQDGNVFLRSVDTLFRNSLDRAMQTMYVDMRPGMRKLSADELSLIDDEVVNHQIGVGRLTERMREANEESIGRLNVIVAQLHGQREARERENPFRPYLLARALYDGIREIASDEPKAKLLFEHLSNALIQHLPGYYNAIREVFESSGVHGKFLAQRSKTAHNQRYFGAPPANQAGAPSDLGARVIPRLQQVLETLQAAPNVTAAAAGEERPATVEDFIRTMFSPSRSFILSPDGEFAKGRPSALAGKNSAPPNPLVTQLNRYQQVAARGQSVDDKLAPEQNQLSALRERMDLGVASPMERMTVDVVAMLFEFILGDEQIPAALRQIIGRLQIPILKAAVLEPELMHDERHPARRLLNRMSTTAVATDSGTQAGQKLAAEIERIVAAILAGFDADTAIFAGNLQDFERFLADYLRQDDGQTTRAIEAVEAAEKFSVLLTNATDALCEVLLPLNADKRISDFIIHVWPHVLVHAVARDAENTLPPAEGDSLFQQYRAVVPELLWSIQEKADADERTALVRMLPDVVRRLRKALLLIQLPEDESKRILDLLVEMHTQILRASPKEGGKPLPGLGELHEEFARLKLGWDRASWSLSEPPRPRASIIEEVFARHGVAAELNLGVQSIASSLADREFLAQTYLLGTRVAFRADGAGELTGQLVWVSTHRSLYLFRQDCKGTPVVFTFASLLEALREETIVPVEYAPVFERAVESLLFDAGNLQAASA